MTIDAIRADELVPIVKHVIDQSHIDSLEWQVSPISGVMGNDHTGGLGLVRLHGVAHHAGRSHSWSMVLKRFDGKATPRYPGDTCRKPDAWNYWKREILAFESGILAELNGSLVAPRCYAITEHPNHEWRLWLEDIQEQPKAWSINRHGLAARHLGQFNGAYLAGRELPPAQPWFYRGHPRSRDWCGEPPPRGRVAAPNRPAQRCGP
jgi:hypothetical protein